MGKNSKSETDQGRLGLVDAYSDVAPRIRRMAARRQIDGEDVGQDACVRMLQVSDRSPIQDLGRYFLRVARNLLVDAERSRVRERAVVDPAADADAVQDNVASPERAVAARERLQQALAVIDGLPPRCGEAFRLHRFEGLSYVQIARRMGISPSMVEKHIAEAMLRLARALGPLDG